MNCADRDQELLLVAHGQSDLATTLAIQVHLLFCPNCRARYQAFLQASNLLRAGTTPVGQGSRGQAGVAVFSRVGILLMAGVILLILSAVLLYANRKAIIRSTPPANHSKPCRPDLPSDHCT